MSEFVQLGHHITIAKGKPPAELPFDGPGAATYLTPEYLRGRAAALQARPGPDAVAVADGDAVLLWDGSNAGEFFSGRAGLAASTMARIRADESIYRGYLVHALKHLEPRLKSQTNGTGIPHVDREVLEGFQVFRPEVLEQTRLARILDILDTTIRQTEAIIEKLKQVKQGLLHDLLTRGIDACGELRPPQDQAPHLYKESPLGWIPASWNASTVGEACDLHNGLRLPLASDVRETMLGDYPYYGPTGILDYINEFRAEGTFVLLGEDGDHFLKFATKPMTQLVSGRFNVNNHAHLLTGRQCHTEWVDVWFRHRDITLFLTRQGAGRFKLNKASLLGLPLAVPSDREQELALDVLASMEGRIAAEQRLRHKRAVQKSGLMDDLLTGRVRVPPLLDATSSA